MAMAQISYKIVRDGDQWTVVRNGEPGIAYVTQEAAFETAAAQAGGDLRCGSSIIIEAAPPTDPAGAREGGGSPVEGDGFST
jgi:hypothetical protein